MAHFNPIFSTVFKCCWKKWASKLLWNIFICIWLLQLQAKVKYSTLKLKKLYVLNQAKIQHAVKRAFGNFTVVNLSHDKITQVYTIQAQKVCSAALCMFRSQVRPRGYQDKNTFIAALTKLCWKLGKNATSEGKQQQKSKLELDLAKKMPWRKINSILCVIPAVFPHKTLTARMDTSSLNTMKNLRGQAVPRGISQNANCKLANRSVQNV